MPQTLTVHLEKPITSAKIVDDYAGGIGSRPSGRDGVDSAANAEQILIRDPEAQKSAFLQAFQALNSVVAKLNQFYDKLFAEHREEIAKLSVEIARKIVAQKVQEGDYEIESIIKEALKNAPTRQDLVVHLNPEDLVECQKAQRDDTTGTLADIKFVADSNIGRAECLLESPQGIVESLIDKHLEQIGNALEKAE